MKIQYLLMAFVMVMMVLCTFSAIPVLFPPVTCPEVLEKAGYAGREFIDDGDVCYVLVMTDDENNTSYWAELEKR